MSRILDGARIRDQILQELKPRVDALLASGRPPGLAVVLAGHNPASEIYVRSKIKACHDLGIFSESLTPPRTVSTEQLLADIDQLNARPDIDGILVQLPLPKQVDEKRILIAIAPKKMSMDSTLATSAGSPQACRGPVPARPPASSRS